MKLFHTSHARSSRDNSGQFRASLGELDGKLDSILQQFPHRLAMAEALVYLPGRDYLVTLAIRPDTAVVLPTRARADSKTILGNVLNTRVPFNGLVSGESGQPRMLETRRVRAIPITHGKAPSQRLLGVVNLESPDPDALTEQSPEAFASLIKEISTILATLPIAQLESDKGAADFLLDMVEKRLIYILDPQRSQEIFHQIRLAAVNLTSPDDVIASIVLRHRDAYRLGFEDENPDAAHFKENPDAAATATDTAQAKRPERVFPIPNKGDPFTFPEKWDLNSVPSITRLALETGQTQYIPDVTDSAYQKIRMRLNSRYDLGSELNIPLKDVGRAFGTFILLSATKRAFSEDDQQIAERIAHCLELITLRLENLLAIFRPREQENVHRWIHDRIDTFSTSSNFARMPAIRDEVLAYIAKNAKEHTGADVAAIVLAEEASNSKAQPSDGEEELVWSMEYCASEIGEPLAEIGKSLADKPFRLRKTEGLIGVAYGTGKTLRVSDVRNLEDTPLKGKYVAAFPQVVSEMVVPLVGRDGIRGVIDVESVQPGHFIHGYQVWVEFLAIETVNLLEAFEMAMRRWFQGRLEKFDGELATMRAANENGLVEIQRQRQKLLQELLDEVRDLTGARKAQIYIAINRDAKEVLGAVTASPHRDIHDRTLRKNLRIDEGMAGTVVTTGKKLFFKDRADRPMEYLSNVIDAESALVEPVLEGPHVIAVLNLESDKPRWCGALQISVAAYAASLVANILIAYKLTLEKLQTEKLLTFDSHRESPDVQLFMRDVLAFMDELTASLDQERWGQLALVEDGVITYAVSGQMPDDVKDTLDEQITQQGWNSYSVFQRAIRDKKPVLIPNLEQPANPEDRVDCPWEHTKSLLCVPLLTPHMESGIQSSGSTEFAESDVSAGFAAVGLLTIASSEPYMLSDSDKTALSRLAPLIVHGLEDIATLYSRVSLMNVLRNEFSALSDPDSKPIDKLRVAIQRIPEMPDPNAAALDAAADFDHRISPFLLLAQLPQMYLLLMKDYPFSHTNMSSDPENPLTLGSVIESLKPLIAIYVAQELGSKVYWESSKPSSEYDASNVKLAIDASDPDGPQLLKAAIFGCVSAATDACLQSEGERKADICVYITTTAQNTASVTVEYVGKPISDSARFSPLLHHTLYGDRHTVEIPELQLSQISRIARRLGGELTVAKPDRGSIHTITLTIPCTL